MHILITPIDAPIKAWIILLERIMHAYPDASVDFFSGGKRLVLSFSHLHTWGEKDVNFFNGLVEADLLAAWRLVPSD